MNCTNTDKETYFDHKLKHVKYQSTLPFSYIPNLPKKVSLATNDLISSPNDTKKMRCKSNKRCDFIYFTFVCS